MCYKNLIKNDETKKYVFLFEGGYMIVDIIILYYFWLLILYSIYKDGGYRIAILNNPKIVDIDNVGYEDNYYKNWVAPDMIVSDKSIND